jgi:predicted dehydrogenase
MERVRLGVIGTSGWTDLMYFNNLKGRPDVELAGVSGRNPKTLAETAERHGIAATYTDYRQLIAQGGLDAVVVAAPDDQHLEMTLAAIDKGLHVLCEKPLANNAADARRMLEAAERRGVRHMVLFTWRWQPHYQFLKSMIDEGALGRIYRAQFSFIGGFARDMVYQWRQDPARANGVLGDLGSHMIDLMRWYFGEIASVSADLGTSIPRAAIAGHESGSGNDSAHLALRLANGAHGVVDVSVVSAAADTLVRQIVRIEAEKATVELEHIFLGERAGVSIRLLGADAAQIQNLEVPAPYFGSSDPRNFLDIYAKEAAGPLAFVAAMRENRQPDPGFDAGVKVQEVVDAALMSDRERRWVDLR